VQVYKMAVCDHFGFDGFECVETKYFLNKGKPWENYREID
jgi:hypothetical protein